MVFTTNALGDIQINVGDKIKISSITDNIMTVYIVASGVIGVSIDEKTNGHDLGGVLSDRSGAYFASEELREITDHIVSVEPIETTCPICGVKVMSNEMKTEGRYVVCSHCSDNLPHCTCCGSVMYYTPSFTSGEHSLCESCRREHTFECNGCYNITMESDSCLRNVRVSGYINSRSYCPTCAAYLHACPECGKYIQGDLEYCSSCIRSLFVNCECCGKLVRKNEAILARPLAGGNAYVCHECAEGLTHCDGCGILSIDPIADPDTGEKKCYTCIIQNYMICSACGTVEKRSPHNYNGTLCRSCRNLSRYGLANCRSGNDARYVPNTSFNHYGYKPDLYMFPRVDVNNPIYYGIELEIDRENRISKSDSWVSDNIVSRVPYAYVKRDGSLNYGAEIVTHPAHIDYHCETMKQSWAELFEFLRRNGYSGHSAGTCGLHIHVSSKPLETLGRDVIEKLIFVWAKFWDKLVVFSRRDVNDDDQMDWAKPIHVSGTCLRETTDEDDAMEELHELRDEERERYSAINLNNRNTVEFRLFRSTLHIDTFCAALQFIDVAVKRCIASSFSELRKMTWEEFVQSDYKELNEYIESRGNVRPNRYSSNWLPEDEDSYGSWCFDREEDEDDDDEDSEDSNW